MSTFLDGVFKSTPFSVKLLIVFPYISTSCTNPPPGYAAATLRGAPTERIGTFPVVGDLGGDVTVSGPLRDLVWTAELELDRGRGIPYEGNYSAWLEQKAKRLEQEARDRLLRTRTVQCPRLERPVRVVTTFDRPNLTFEAREFADEPNRVRAARIFTDLQNESRL